MYSGFKHKVLICPCVSGLMWNTGSIVLHHIGHCNCEKEERKVTYAEKKKKKAQPKIPSCFHFFYVLTASNS